METEIATMEAQEYILKLEKQKMAAELIVKQGIIDAQAAELLQIRQDFAKQAEELKASDEKFKKSLESLNHKVF